MLKKIVCFLLGIFLSSYSLMFIIIYLNLLRMNFNIFQYFKYICTRYECLLLIVGIILICVSMRKEKKKYELHL